MLLGFGSKRKEKDVSIPKRNRVVSVVTEQQIVSSSPVSSPIKNMARIAEQQREIQLPPAKRERSPTTSELSSEDIESPKDRDSDASFKQEKQPARKKRVQRKTNAVLNTKNVDEVDFDMEPINTKPYKMNLKNTVKAVIPVSRAKRTQLVSKELSPKKHIPTTKLMKVAPSVPHSSKDIVPLASTVADKVQRKEPHPKGASPPRSPFNDARVPTRAPLTDITPTHVQMNHLASVYSPLHIQIPNSTNPDENTQESVVPDSDLRVIGRTIGQVDHFLISSYTRRTSKIPSDRCMREFTPISLQN